MYQDPSHSDSKQFFQSFEAKRPVDARRHTIIFEIEDDLSQQAARVLHLLASANDPPFLFQNGRRMVRVSYVKGRPNIEVLTKASLRAALTERVRFSARRLRKASLEVVGCNLSLELAEYLLSMDSWPLPELDGVVNTPSYTANGQLITREGYTPGAQVFLHLPGFCMPDLPSKPTSQQVTQACSLILDELLVDFPFADDASKAHAVALGLLPFVRMMIKGPTPLHLISAPVQGTGKSLLAGVLSLVATGRDPDMMTEAPHEDEWRKRITATLSSSPTYILLDNITRSIDSAALAAALTTRTWGDRLLGKSTMVTALNNATWVATGNNPTMSGEIARRTLWIHLESRVEQPWQRRGFRHHPLPNWVEQNRSRLVWAFLMLIQNWVAKGMPPSSAPQTLGSFEEWKRVIGGILETAGINGLLTNMDCLHERADRDSSEWRSFVKAWWQKYGDRPVLASTLCELAHEYALLSSVLHDPSLQKQAIRLGYALKDKLGRIIGGYRLEHAGKHSHLKVGQYRLARMDDSGTRVDSAGS